MWRLKKLVETVNIPCTKKEAHLTYDLWKLKNKKRYDKLILKSCGTCGQSKNLQIHHINGDKRNNLVSNLKILCVDCHRHIHLKFKVNYLDTCSVRYLLFIKIAFSPMYLFDDINRIFYSLQQNKDFSIKRIQKIINKYPKNDNTTRTL